jgi:hypothetical protein
MDLDHIYLIQKTGLKDLRKMFNKNFMTVLQTNTV